MHKFLARINDPEQREQGFTLIELLVVIIIIGILSAIAIPIFLNQKKKGVDATVKSDVRNAVSQVESSNSDKTTSVVNLTNGQGVTVSSGNSMQIIGDPAEGYCIEGFNANGTATSATNAYYYASQTGALTKGDPTADNACKPAAFPKATNGAGVVTAAAFVALTN